MTIKVECQSSFCEDTRQNHATFESSYVLEVAVADADQTGGAGGPTSRAELMSIGDLRS